MKKIINLFGIRRKQNYEAKIHKIEMIECTTCGHLNPIGSLRCSNKKCRNRLTPTSKIVEEDENLLGKTRIKTKTKEDKMGYWEHFGSFALITVVVLWLLSSIIPIIIPFVVLATIFTIFIYPGIKIKERLKKRDK